MQKAMTMRFMIVSDPENRLIGYVQAESLQKAALKLGGTINPGSTCVMVHPKLGELQLDHVEALDELVSSESLIAHTDGTLLTRYNQCRQPA